MGRTAAGGYTVDDLDWVRAQWGVAHVEIDPWGNLVVTLATDRQELAVFELDEQFRAQLPSTVQVGVNGPAWRVPGGSGYLNVPDLTVLRRGVAHPGG